MVNIDNIYPAMRDRIFDLIAEMNLSQKQFAEMIDVKPQTITDWKKGNSSSFVRMVEKIASALQTTSSWLFFGEGKKHFSSEERNRLIEQEERYLHAASQEESEREFRKLVELKELLFPGYYANLSRLSIILDAGGKLGKEKKLTSDEGGEPDRNIIKLAGRDGTHIERELTDEQVALMKTMLDQLKPVDDGNL